MGRHPAYTLMIMAVLTAACGASCPRMRQSLVEPAPVVFEQPPSLQEVIQTVNANATPVQQFQTDAATLAIEGMPVLRANIAVAQPRKIRLRANFMGVGEVLDVGSNDQYFWALVDAPEVATNVPRAVYYARHDQFRIGMSREILPIQPQWMAEAMGLVALDPNGEYQGPYSRGQDQLEIRARVPTLDGDVTKVMVLDARYGWILQQHWYDPEGQLLTSAIASNHRYDSALGVSLPHHIEIRLPPPAKSFAIDVERYAVNQQYSDPSQLWNMPKYEGYPRIDLSHPPAASSTAAPPPSANGSGPGYSPPAGYPSTGFRPNYRGGYSPYR